jgi:replicative DNA helicase
MTREQARQEINQRIAELPKANKKANGYDTLICPVCGNGSGEDGDGIATTDEDGKIYKCFKCGTGGDYLHFLREKYNCSENEIFAKYGLIVDDEQNGNVPQKNSYAYNTGNTQKAQEAPKKPLPHPKSEKSPQTFTLHHDGLREETTNTIYPHRIDVKDKETFAAAVAFDHVGATYKENKRSKNGFMSSNCVMMDIDNDKTDNPDEWINENHVKEKFAGVPFYICCSRNHLKQKEKDGVTKAPRPKMHIYFPIDDVTDATEYETIKKNMVEVFPAFDDSAKDAARQFFGVETPKIAFYPGDKNLLTFLQENDPERIEYMNTSAAHHIQAFIGDIDAKANTPAISTGFAKLDEKLDGGLYEGLYIIGAISSLGKTTYILQIADQIAKQGRDVLFFSLEMSRYELMAKSISRLTFENCGGKEENAKTTRGILAGAKRKNYSEVEKELIKKSISDYAEYSKNIYIHEGIGDIGVEKIRNEVEKHIIFTGNKPVVFIDYLQIIAPHEPRATDKQNTDKAVLELKRLSRDIKIPLIAISSFNRENYTSPVNMQSFKESGAVEYSSDILIGLQFKGMDDFKSTEGQRSINIKTLEAMKNEEPRNVELKILKNRNGKTGISLYYEYYPKFNRFDEIAEGKENIDINDKDNWNNKTNKKERTKK